MDIYNKIQELNDELFKQIKISNENGVKYATAFRNYRILLAQELLRLKADGMPVTIAYDIARGNENVANAKFEELSTEAIYNASKEQINALKLNIKILQNQYDKEWGMAGGNYNNF